LGNGNLYPVRLDEGSAAEDYRFVSLPRRRDEDSAAEDYHFYETSDYYFYEVYCEASDYHFYEVCCAASAERRPYPDFG